MPKAGVIEFGVKETDSGIEGTFNFDFGATIEEAIKRFGGEVVHNKFCQAAVISAATGVRRSLKAKKTLEEAQNVLNDWKPTVGAIRTKKDPVAALAAAIDKLSPEDQAKSKAKLEALLAGME